MHVPAWTKTHWQPALVSVCLMAIAAGPLYLGRSLVPETELGVRALPAENRSRDATPAVLDLPRESLIARGLHDGRLPLWNSHVGAGTPLWAEQGNPFFPLKWLYYAVPTRLTYHLVLLSRLVIAFIGAWLLARALGQSREAASVAATAFTTSGIALTHVAFMTTHSQFLMPWCALAGLWAARRERGVWPGVVLGLNILGGHPTVAALGGVCFGVVAVVELARTRTLGGAKHLVTSIVIGALLGAVVWLPFIDVLQHGASYKGTDDAANMVSDQLAYLRKGQPLAIAWPTLVDMPAGGIVGWPIAAMCVLGAVTTTLAGAGARWWPRAPIALALTLVGFALTLHLPSGVVERVPLLRDITPLYPLSLVALGLGLLAGVGVEALTKERLVPIISAALVWGALATLGIHHWQDNAHQLVPLRALPVVALVLVPVAFFAARKTASWRELLLAVCVAAEPLAALIPTSGHASDASLYRAEPLTPVNPPREGGRFYSQEFHTLFPNAASLTPLSDFRVCSPIVPKRYAAYLDTMGGYRGTYVFPFKPTASALGLASVSQVGQGRAWQSLPFVARARLVHEVVFTTPAGALEATRSLLDSGKWETVIAVEDETRAVGAAVRAESVSIERDTPERLEVTVQSSAPGYLVVNDTWLEGWEASVDGVSSEIVPVNIGFRGVWLGEGTHHVVMKYSPRAVWLGLAATLMTTALLIVWSRRRRS